MTDYFKYPRTPHLDFSPGFEPDDIFVDATSELEGSEVIVTEKMDGECTTLYADGYQHARSIDSKGHSSRDITKAWWAARHMHLPTGWRVCGENLYAKHSLHYENLKSYLYGFSIWDENNACLSWDETLEWFDELDITPVDVLYRGPFDVKALKAIIDKLDLTKQEGIVVRKASAFNYTDFQKSCAKWVRKGHVQTSEHWMKQAVVPNKLKS